MASARGRLRSELKRAGRRAAARLRQLIAAVRRGEHAFVVVVAVVIGALAATGAILFRTMILFAHEGFFATGEYSLDILEALPWWRRILMPSVGGIVVGLVVTRLAPEVKGSGIPEVMEAVARKGGAIRARVVLTKAVAAALTIGSGGSAGREGPIVHIGSAIGSAMGQLLHVPPRMLRTFVACGAAAGIAATFNAPIAGALFAVEVVLGDLAVASLSPIVISSVVATVISRHYLGDFPALRVPPYDLRDPRELLLYGLLGLGAGLVSVAFIRILHGTASLFERSRIPAWLRPAAGGLGVGLIALVLPNVFGVGYETMDAALWGRMGALVLAALVLAKMVATSLTLGSGGSGGVFAPSLFVGAALGAAFGAVVGALFPSWTASPAAYALVGMGAVVAGTTHAPIAAILIIFEMTNDYRSIPPLMLSCVLAVLLSGLINRHSIYTEKLARRGVRLFEGRDVNLLAAIEVREVMDGSAKVVEAGMPFSELLPLLLTGRHREVVVVDGEGRYLGAVELRDVKTALPDSGDLGPLAVAADVVDESIPFVLPRDTLDVVMHLFGRTHRDELPVCHDADSRRVVGVVTRDAVIDAYNRRVFQADLTSGFGSLVAAVEAGRTVEVLGGLHLAEVEVPASLYGVTLADADLRRSRGVEVVMIQTPSAPEGGIEGRPGKFPSPEVRLEPGDRLLVLGSAEAIESLRR